MEEGKQTITINDAIDKITKILSNFTTNDSEKIVSKIYNDVVPKCPRKRSTGSAESDDEYPRSDNDEYDNDNDNDDDDEYSRNAPKWVKEAHLAKDDCENTTKIDFSSDAQNSSESIYLDINNHDKTEVAGRILSYLRDNNINTEDDAVKPLTISSHIFGNEANKKLVNPTLYKLMNTGKVCKITESNGTRPKWYLQS